MSRVTQPLNCQTRVSTHFCQSPDSSLQQAEMFPEDQDGVLWSESYMDGEGLWAALGFQAPRLPLQLTHSSIFTGQQISYSQNAGVIIANSGEVILIAIITSSDMPRTHSGHQTLCQGVFHWLTAKSLDSSCVILGKLLCLLVPSFPHL